MPRDPGPATPSAAKAPRKKRRALRVAGWVLGTPLVLAGLVLAYLHTGAGKARVRGLVLERLRERVDGQVEVGAVDYALLGDVRLAEVHLRDPQGVEAVALGSLTVRPSWGDLLRGRLVIDRVALAGLAVHVVKDADGGSNLSRLLKPRPEDPARKPLDRRVEVKVIDLSGLAVDVLQPDGTKILLSDAAVEGALSVLPSEKAVDVEIGRLALSALVDKGEGGLKLGVTGLQTGLSVKLDKGVGKATLHPLKGHVAVTLPERAERGFDIELGGFSADVGEGGVGVSLDKLLAGAVALASVEVKGRLQDGKIDGSQQADVLGLKVSGARVNEFLGTDVLLGDIDIETHVLGPPDKIAVATKITTPGAQFDVDGAVGVADPANPTYEVALTVTGVDTEKVLAPSLGVAPVAVEEVKATVKGKGRSLDRAGAVVTLGVTGATARGVRVDGLDFEGELEKGVLHVRSVEARALGQRVTASGDVEIATKRIDLTAGVEGDVGEVLARLKAAGLPVKSTLPRGAVRLPPGDLTVKAKGFLGGAIDVEATATRLNVFGGAVGLDARASLLRHDPPLDGGKKVTVTALDADVKLGGIKLSSLLAMRGKKLEGMEGTLSGEVHVEGTPEDPKARVLLGLATSRADGGKTVRLSVTGDVTKGSADVRASLVPDGEAKEMLGISARLPLSLGAARKGIDPYRPLRVHASLPRRTFADLWALVPDAAIPAPLQAILDGGLNLKLIPGDVALDLDVAGTAAKPDGKLHLAATARMIPGFSQAQKLEIDASLAPAGKASSPAATPALDAKMDVGLWLDAAGNRLVQVGSKLALSRSPALGPAEVGHHTAITIGPVEAKDFFMAPEVQALGGTLLGSITLDGDREDLNARVLLTADGVRPRGLGPVGLGASVALGDDATTVDVKVRVPSGPGAAEQSDALALSGKVGLAGKKLFAQLREKKHRDAPLDLALSIPKRALASLAWLDERLAKAPGSLQGNIPITGTVKTPLAKGSILLTDVARADGKTGGAAVAIDAGADELLAQVGLGVPDAAQAPLEIAVRAPRASVATLGEGGTLPVFVTIRADRSDIRQLLPAALAEGTRVGFAGTLDANLVLRAELSRPAAGKKVRLTGGSATGLFDLHDATISLPGTKRAYHGVGLALRADDKGLHLDALRARESDPGSADRTLLVKADVGLDRLKPTAAALSIDARRWLVFGPRALGKPDAPRGTLTLAATAKADLSRPVRTVSATLSELELLVPDRFERAHQPEDVQAGDVVFLGEDKVPLGKLAAPAPPEKEAPKPSAAAIAELRKAGKEEGWDIGVHIAEGVHLLQAPIDLWPSGDVSVKIRPWGREIKAHVEMGKGGLSLAGVGHGLVKGSIVFDEKNPKGVLDLEFERPMRAAALRQISEASGGKAVRVHMFGPLSDRKTVLSGAGTAGALWDVLSMHHTGRARYVSEPDLPWSMSTEFPQHDSLLVLGFLAVNLPHLLFVDRFAVWGDPYDDPRAYGRLTHFEAERFTAGDALRFRVGARPPSAGQSEAEAEIDYVIVNVPRMLLGVGLTGGTRGGGGPGLVWEWSSKD